MLENDLDLPDFENEFIDCDSEKNLVQENDHDSESEQKLSLSRKNSESDADKDYEECIQRAKSGVG